MGIYIPHPGNEDVAAFIAANVPNPTGAIADDFRAALVASLGLEEPPYLSTDDLWKLYLATDHGPFLGMHPKAYGPDFELGASGASGDFPVVEGVSGANSFQPGDNELIPPGTVAAGELLLAMTRTRDNADVPTASTGWEKLAETESNGNYALWGRIAEASEEDTLTVGTTGYRFAAQMLRISGARNGLTSDELAITIGVHDNLGATEPSWGSAKTLWIRGHSARAANWAMSQFPEEYTAIALHKSTNFQQNDSTNNNCSLFCVRRDLEAGEEGPDSTFGGANGLRGMRIGIRPA